MFLILIACLLYSVLELQREFTVLSTPGSQWVKRRPHAGGWLRPLKETRPFKLLFLGYSSLSISINIKQTAVINMIVRRRILIELNVSYAQQHTYKANPDYLYVLSCFRPVVGGGAGEARVPPPHP